MNKIYKILNKMEHFSGSYYCGYLTPNEIIILVDNNIWTAQYKDVERCRVDIKKVISNPQWFYCILPDKLSRLTKKRGSVRISKNWGFNNERVS